MATLSVVLDGTPLHTPGGAFQVSDPQNGPDWGSQAVADVLLTGQYRAEELDQVAAEAGLTRTVTIPLKVDAASADQLVTLQQTLTSTLARASKYAPLTLTVTPENSTHVSTFKVWGGSWSGRYDNVALAQNLAFGTLTLLCYWPVYGAAQNLGSSGAPLITNTASPAAVTLTPSPAGDIPADVTLFVKNRSASPIISLTASVISGNTTWVQRVLATTWTDLGPGGLVGSVYTVTTSDTSTVQTAAAFATPALPTDQRFRILLRTDEQLAAGTAPASFRIRVATGATELIGEWRTPPNLNTTNLPTFVADMGGFLIPVSEVGALGAGSTTSTVTVEVRGNDTSNVVTRFYEALFVPESSTLIVETSDTAKVLAAASAVARVETDQAYDSSGNAAGGVVSGPQFRVLGTSRAYVYTSQAYMANMSLTDYGPENVDVYATVTPRYIGLA